MPPFDLQGGVTLAAARGAAVAGLLFVFGGAVFRVAILRPLLAPPSSLLAERLESRLLKLQRTGTAAALAAMLVWMLVQSQEIAGTNSWRDTLAALPTVLTQTNFGHLALLQFATLAAALASLTIRRTKIRWIACLVFAAAALALQAGHGHAASMYEGVSWLLLIDLLHLAGAAAWLGSLPPLLLVVRTADTATTAAAAHRFSPLGQMCVAAMIVSAAWQGWVLVGSLAGLAGTAYGWLVLVKLTLFAVLLAFATVNRFRLTPALSAHDPAAGRQALVRSIAWESGVALAIVAAAAVLSNLPPAMHLQPLWPFAYRFSTVTIHEDIQFRNEVLGAVFALAAAIVLLVVAALLRRRASLLPASIACVIAWFAVPHLALLLVPANPTNYYHAPTHFAAASIEEGGTLYPSHCAACHGADATGDGPQASALPVPPADLTAAHLWMHSDGDLFWWLTHGIVAPDGQQAMPGFAGVLSVDQRWALIDYIRARNAGLAFQHSGQWPVALQAPNFQARCVSDQIVTLTDLRGRFVRIVIGSAAPVAGVTTIAIGSPQLPETGLCVSEDPAPEGAYAIVAGLSKPQLQGTAFLIDLDGWLRAVQRPGARPGWSDPGVLASIVRNLPAHPAGPAAEEPMPMHMKM